MHLVAYLQDRYKVVDANIVTHRYAQQGDHTDPVNFDFEEFIATKDRFRNQAIAYRVDRIRQDASSWKAVPAEVPATIDEAVTSTVESQQGALPFSHREPAVRGVNAVISNPPSRQEENVSTPALRGPIEMEPGFVPKLDRQSVNETPTQANPSSRAQNSIAPAAVNAPPAVTTPQLPAGTTPAKQPAASPIAVPHLVPAPSAAPQAVPDAIEQQTAPNAGAQDKTRFFIQPPASVP